MVILPRRRGCEEGGRSRHRACRTDVRVHALRVHGRRNLPACRAVFVSYQNNFSATVFQLRILRSPGHTWIPLDSALERLEIQAHETPPHPRIIFDNFSISGADGRIRRIRNIRTGTRSPQKNESDQPDGL